MSFVVEESESQGEGEDEGGSKSSSWKFAVHK